MNVFVSTRRPYIAFERSSWAFLTIASFEWVSTTGNPVYGALLEPWSIKVHSFIQPVWGVSELNLTWNIYHLIIWNSLDIVSYIIYMYKHTSSIHVPWGYSPQVWVVINGHLVKPSRWSSSLTRRLKIIDL